jgi:hypothetical protein
MQRAPIGALFISLAACGSGYQDLAGVGIGHGATGLVLRRRRRGPTAVGGLVEAVSVAVHGEDADVVGQPVEQRTGETFGAEHLGPVLERKVGHDDCRAAFISLRDDLEQQLRPCGGQRHLAEFVDDEQLHRGEVSPELNQAPLVAGFHQLADQRRGGHERYREPLLAGCQTEREGDTRLAGAAVAKRNDVLASQEGFATGFVRV